MSSVMRTIVSCIFICISFLYILFFHIVLVVSDMKVNQVPLAPSWSDLEVDEPQFGPDFPGATSLSTKHKHKTAVPLGS